MEEVKGGPVIAGNRYIVKLMYPEKTRLWEIFAASDEDAVARLKGFHGAKILSVYRLETQLGEIVKIPVEVPQ